MNPKSLVPLVYMLAGLLFFIVVASFFREAGLGEYAPLTVVLGTGLVGIAGGVATRHRWQAQDTNTPEERDPPS